MSTNGQVHSASHVASLPSGERMLAMIQALNAAATESLHSSCNEDDVFQAFGKQLSQLGIEGAFFLYDELTETVQVRHLVFAPEILKQFQKMKEELGFDVFEQPFLLSQSHPLTEVVIQKQIRFFPEATFLPAAWVGQKNSLTRGLGKRTMIVAPLLHDEQVLGLFAASGTHLTEVDVPYMAAFANQITVALLNSRLIAAAHQSEQKYRHLFEEAPIMYVVTEKQGDEAYIAECNQRMCDQLGYSKADLIGRPLSTLYTEQSKQELHQGGYQRALMGTFVAEERQLITRDGRILEMMLRAMPELDADGQVVGTRAMYVDITPRKEAEAMLQAYQEKLNRSIDELNVLVPAGAIVSHATQNEEIIYDIAEYLAAAFDGDGCALYQHEPGVDLLRPLVNVQRVRAIWGVGTEATTGPILFSPAIRQALNQKLTVFLSRQQTDLHPDDAEILNRHQANTILLIPMIVRDEVIGLAELYSYHARDYEPRQRLFVQTLANYLASGLENARLFEALRYANEALEQRVSERTQELAVRNQELDDFAHTVAHDLQGLLAHVVMAADAAEQEFGIDGDVELRGYLRLILQSGRKMQEVIESLFLLATVGKAEVQLESLDMAPIICEVLNRLDPEIQAAAATITQPDSWPACVGYRPWIEAIWVNYINNALKYGGEPPQITLGVTLLDNEKVQFWVQDNGPGIAPENQSHIFEPFTRVRRREKGHGLGLSIVKRISHRLGGEVGVISEVDQGSRFYFTLPQRVTPSLSSPLLFG